MDDFCRSVDDSGELSIPLAVDLLGATPSEVGRVAQAIDQRGFGAWDPVTGNRLAGELTASSAGFILCGANDVASCARVAEFSEWIRTTGLRSAVREHGVICSQLVSNVEICSLNTASRVEGLWHAEAHLPEPVYDIHAHAYVKQSDTFNLAEFEDAIFSTNRCWKVLTKEGRYLEDVGYTSNTGLHGIEFWPDFCGRTHIRSNAPVVGVDFGGTVPFLLGYDGAYYHWLLNWLPRLMAFDLFPERLGPLSRVKILTGGLIPICRESLLQFGVGADNIIELDDLVNYRIPRVIVPSFISNSRVSARIAAWYRSKLPANRHKKGGERIYISRSDAIWTGRPRRQVVNEAEVVDTLAARGFKAHVLSSYSFLQQVDLFAQAECVVAAHGAGFANMVFSPPNTPAIIFENEWRHTFMQEAMNALGHRSTILNCEDVFSASDEEGYVSEGMEETEVRRNRNLRVSPTALSALLDMVLS